MCSPADLTSNYGHPSILTNLHNQPDGSCSKRVGLLGITLLSFCTKVGDTVIGIIGGVAAVLTAGLSEGVNRFALRQLRWTNTLLSYPPFHFIQITVNPYAVSGKSLNALPDKNPNTVSSKDPNALQDNDPNTVSSKDPNALPAKDLQTLDCLNCELEWLYSCLAPEGCSSHLTGRIMAVIFMITLIISRAIRSTVGAAAGVLAFVTVGKVNYLNTVFIQHFQPLGIIQDIFFCTIKCINPFATINATIKKCNLEISP